jgi:hypothetical protein
VLARAWIQDEIVKKKRYKMKTENPSNLIPGRSISHYQYDISYVKNQCLIDSMPSASNNRLNLVRGQTIEKRWGSPADDEHRHGEVATERSLSSLCCPSAERVRRQPVHRAPQCMAHSSQCLPTCIRSYTVYVRRQLPHIATSPPSPVSIVVCTRRYRPII